MNNILNNNDSKTISSAMKNFIKNKNITYTEVNSQHSDKLISVFNDKAIEILKCFYNENDTYQSLYISNEDEFNIHFGKQIVPINNNILRTILADIINKMKQMKLINSIEEKDIYDYVFETIMKKTFSASTNINFCYDSFFNVSKFPFNQLYISKSFIIENDIIREKYIINAFHKIVFIITDTHNGILIDAMAYDSTNVFNLPQSNAMSVLFNENEDSSRCINNIIQLNLQKLGIFTLKNNVFDQEIISLYEILQLK